MISSWRSISLFDWNWISRFQTHFSAWRKPTALCGRPVLGQIWREFISNRKSGSEIVDNIKLLRHRQAVISQVKTVAKWIWVKVVFEIHIQTAQSSSATYQPLILFLKRSYKLKTEEQDAIQQLLADASGTVVVI